MKLPSPAPQASKRALEGQLDPDAERFRRKLFRNFGKIKPHGRDLSLAMLSMTSLDSAQRKAVADLRLMVQMGGEPVSECRCHIVGCDGETINFTERCECDIARNEEIPDSPDRLE